MKFTKVENRQVVGYTSNYSTGIYQCKKTWNYVNNLFKTNLIKRNRELYDFGKIKHKKLDKKKELYKKYLDRMWNVYSKQPF